MSNGDLLGRVTFDPGPSRRRIRWTTPALWSCLLALVGSATVTSVAMWVAIANESEPGMWSAGLLGLALVVFGALISGLGERDAVRAIGRGVAWGPPFALASALTLWWIALAQVGPT